MLASVFPSYDGAQPTSDVAKPPPRLIDEAALESNRTIGIAIGITMARRCMSHDAALAHLVKRSQDSNTKLRTLAQQIVMSSDDAATVVSIA